MTPPIMLFAAGLGTRMAHLVQDRPKPLVPVAGKALIDHALDLVDGAGVRDVVINLHYKPDMLRDHLAGRDISFSDESDALLETGGGLRHAMPLFSQSPVMTLNTDAVWRGPNPVDLILQHWRDDMEALLLLVPPNQAHGHKGKGDFHIAADGKLSRGPGAIYTGLQMIRTETLNAVKAPAFSMNVIWDQMAARGGLFGLQWSGQWCDVGQPDSIAIAERMLHV